MKQKLVHFQYMLNPVNVTQAWHHSNRLSAARGLPPPPTNYRRFGICVRVHPDDVDAMYAFCRELERSELTTPSSVA